MYRAVDLPQTYRHWLATLQLRILTCIPWRTCGRLELVALVPLSGEYIVCQILEEFLHECNLFRRVVSRGLKHVKECELCQARAHICEGCRSSKTIFPFQVGVVECEACLACYHRTCYKPATGCGRCVRRLIRQQAQPEVCWWAYLNCLQGVLCDAYLWSDLTNLT